jgi:hypothetical protein
MTFIILLKNKCNTRILSFMCTSRFHSSTHSCFQFSMYLDLVRCQTLSHWLKIGSTIPCYFFSHSTNVDF